MLSLFAALQITGYLPPPPPRQPITDPLFAASPVREFRRNWDDCIHDVKQLLLINGMTDEQQALRLVDLSCADKEDRLTGEMVKRHGYAKATSAMRRAHDQMTDDLRKYLRQIYEAKNPKPARWEIVSSPSGCQALYMVPTGPIRPSVNISSYTAPGVQETTIALGTASKATAKFPLGFKAAGPFLVAVKDMSGAKSSLGSMTFIIEQNTEYVRLFRTLLTSQLETALASAASIEITNPIDDGKVEFPLPGFAGALAEHRRCYRPTTSLKK